MNRYGRLAILAIVGVIALLALIVFASAARDALVAEGVAVNQTVFAVIVVAVLLGVYVYFVKLVRVELKRLAEQSAPLRPEE